MRHLSRAATAWELEAERRREILDADMAAIDAVRAARMSRIAATSGPGLIERVMARLGGSRQRPPAASNAPCQPAVKPGG